MSVERPETISKQLHLLHLMIEEFYPEEAGKCWYDFFVYILHTPTDTPEKDAFDSFLAAYEFDGSMFEGL